MANHLKSKHPEQRFTLSSHESWGPDLVLTVWTSTTWGSDDRSSYGRLKTAPVWENALEKRIQATQRRVG